MEKDNRGSGGPQRSYGMRVSLKTVLFLDAMKHWGCLINGQIKYLCPGFCFFIVTCRQLSYKKFKNGSRYDLIEKNGVLFDEDNIRKHKSLYKLNK